MGSFCHIARFLYRLPFDKFFILLIIFSLVMLGGFCTIDEDVNKETSKVPSRTLISPQVVKRLRELDTTAEEVLRKALDIKAEGLTVAEGVYFPEGTVFLAWYKDNTHVGRVRDGAISVNDKPFTSVSGAAAEITGRPTTNGWDFWQVKLPGKNEFFPIKTLRDKSK